MPFGGASFTGAGSLRWAALAPYVGATLLVAACAGLRWLADPVLGPLARFLPFVLAVTSSTYIGGPSVGFFSTALSVATGIVLFVGDPLASARGRDLLNVVLFLVQCAGIVALTDLLRRARNDARSAADRAAAAARARDDFIARVSHEWRTPLNAIMGWASQLRGRSEDSEFVRRAAASMMRASETQMRLINDLLEYSRDSRGAMSIQPARLLVSPQLKASIDGLRQLADDRGIHIDATLDPSAPRVWGDGVRLNQLFTNLIGNAIKFTPSGGRISIREHVVDGCVEITIQDTGMGIEASALPRLFSAFEQGNPTRDSALGGVGLGLAIARQIAQLHAGSVTAASDGPNLGSTFTVKLPIAVAERDPSLSGTAA